MRARTLILFVVAILLAGSTAMLVRSWLVQQRTVEAEAAPMPPPPVQKSVLVARSAIPRGQILKPTDLAWQAWPDGGLDHAYIQKGAKAIEDLAGWVTRDPFGPGEPITEPKIVAAWQPGLSSRRAAPRHARRLSAGHPHLRNFRVCLPGRPG